MAVFSKPCGPRHDQRLSGFTRFEAKIVDMTPHMRRIFLVAMLLPTGLSACSADSTSEVRDEVDGYLTPDMNREQAIHAVRQAGFECLKASGSGDEVSETRCSRTKSHRLLASCVQHVMLLRSTDLAKGLVVIVPEPVCTGL
ncbi:hypothetical protein [Porphyrobacter sp. CACIAM 03H1]|uniref:hypothetical protein n=1 Tax=Porphyrobacter sp. CACIAM 03H1 TaxID=2003315 RepID=UPI0012FDBFEE|nr:hypothetical protein [Porphyrobacter sp. CACIAM 03H1]